MVVQDPSNSRGTIPPKSPLDKFPRLGSEELAVHCVTNPLCLPAVHSGP